MKATPGVSGAPSAPHSLNLNTHHSPPRGWLRRTQYAAQASQSCLQTSVLCLPPGCARRALEGRHARPRPGQTRRARVRPPARSSRTRPRRNPGPAKGFPAARGLVAPRTPSVSRETHRERAEAPELRGAHGGRSGRTLRPPGPIAGARTPGRRKQASPRPRRAHSPPLHGPGVVTQPRASSSAELRREASHS